MSDRHGGKDAIDNMCRLSGCTLRAAGRASRPAVAREGDEEGTSTVPALAADESRRLHGRPMTQGFGALGLGVATWAIVAGLGWRLRPRSRRASAALRRRGSAERRPCLDSLVTVLGKRTSASSRSRRRVERRPSGLFDGGGPDDAGSADLERSTRTNGATAVPGAKRARRGRSASARAATSGLRATSVFGFPRLERRPLTRGRRAGWCPSVQNRRSRRGSTDTIESPRPAGPRSAQMLPRPRGFHGHPAARPTHAATTNSPANLKFPRKGASRLHPHPPHPTGPGPVPRVPQASATSASTLPSRTSTARAQASWRCCTSVIDRPTPKVC